MASISRSIPTAPPSAVASETVMPGRRDEKKMYGSVHAVPRAARAASNQGRSRGSNPSSGAEPERSTA